MTHIHSCNKGPFLAGISFSQEKNMHISYVIGKLSFINPPKVYEEGSNVEGKVSACGLHSFSVILYSVQMKTFSVIQLCVSDRLKQFTTMTHPLLTCRCTCLRVKRGHHVGCRISQRTAMVSLLSHLAQLIFKGTSTSR